MGEIVTFDISVTLRSPFLFRGLVGARLGFDAAQLRDTDGRPVIPADQLRGVLAAATHVLAERAPSVWTSAQDSALFGGESLKNPDRDPELYDPPNRARLFLSDLVASSTEPSQSAEASTRVAIDDATGAAAEGKLQSVELVAPVGSDVTFRGTAVLHASPRHDLDAGVVETALQRALALVPALGAYKSAGFGEVVGTHVAMGHRRPVSVARSGTVPERECFRVSFDRPIMVDASRETDNLFVSRMIVPGSVFKGALATRLALAGIDTQTDGLWSDALAKLRISHAFPLGADGREADLPVPFSAVSFKGNKDDSKTFADLLLAADGVPIDADGSSGVFPIDWKYSVDKEFREEALLKFDGAPLPRAELPAVPRTHVRIDRRRLAATRGALFTTVARETASTTWRLTVDYADVPTDCRAAFSQLIAAGLGPIGRTDAEASFTPVTDEMPRARPVAVGSTQYAITLITPALLADPEKLIGRTAGDYVEDYGGHRAQQTGGTLLRCFAGTRLAGGYLATRYRPFGRTYYPFVLVEPGSVFLVEGGDPKKLDDVARFGLAPPANFDGTPLTWRNCPYLPQNGYGAVRFNLIPHAALRRS